MANEALKVEGPYEVHDFTITDGDSLSGLSLMQLEDARAIGISGGAAPAFAGILVVDKVANNAKTEVGCYTKGDFILTAVPIVGPEGAIIAGSLVVISGVNLIRKATSDDFVSGVIVGKAWEAIAAGTTGEVHVGVLV